MGSIPLDYSDADLHSLMGRKEIFPEMADEIEKSRPAAENDTDEPGMFLSHSINQSITFSVLVLPSSIPSVSCTPLIYKTPSAVYGKTRPR